MKILAFDTAIGQMSIALGLDGAVLAVEAPGGAQASATLLPTIVELLAGAGIRLRDLDAIAFGRGPGAFTGLRTACAVAQGLAFGAGKPVVPVDSLLAVAETARGDRSADWQVWAVLDARMDEIYAASYRYAAGRWRVVDMPALLSPAALCERWQAEPPGAVAGNALAVFGPRLDTHGADTFAAAAPGARAILQLAAAALAEGGGLDPTLALPLYLRDKVAQTTAERDAARAAKAVPEAVVATAGRRAPR